MDARPRYEIVDTIATGDFGTVYRARDRELGREVAIKQIHQQFLSDERQLARYWQEAQLLASLQHPHILTIYDIVRSRGWLIVELMRGSLKQVTQGEPIDLDFLRVALACTLSALHFLHGNGIVHGDVKPSNLLVDAQNRVKLGDFGLARRAASEEGSLLKGTTKYMAPELVSNQFGPVGPASDLYSLGFSAFELMCGNQFDSLFPGLATFGRDKQIAWMMWHAAPDRQLPEINRVLQGVPDDLARVIQRLVVKDQSRRYQSARDVLQDLRPGAVSTIADDKGPTPLPPPPPRRKQILIFSGAFFAVLLTSLALFWKSGPPPRPPGPPPPTEGVVRNVYPEERELVLEVEGKPRQLTIKQRDRIEINGHSSLLRDLEPGDLVSIRTLRDEAQVPFSEILARRAQMHRGRVAAVKADEGTFTFSISEGELQGKKIVAELAPKAAVSFNGKDQLDGHPVRVADLQTDDRVEVGHLAGESGHPDKAVKLVVQREVKFSGILRSVDDSKHELTFAVGESANPELFTLPYAPKCQVTINGRQFLAEQLVKPADLKPGDKAEVLHDLQIVRIDATRILGTAGVIQKAEYPHRIMEVMNEGATAATTYVVSKTCNISLGGQPAEFEDLRVGDVVDITHDNVEAKMPEARVISARRPPQANRWAILIGTQDYEDATLSKLKYPVADVKLLQEVLIQRYGVPVDQILALTDESHVRLEQGIPAFLGRVKAESTVILYVAGHAYKCEDDEKIYLAPKNFSFKNMPADGLPFSWLVEQYEACPAQEKMLFLDCSHEGDGADLKLEPDSSSVIRSLPVSSTRAPLKTITGIASCKREQHGLDLPAKEHGLFAWFLAQGYSGLADKNRDGRIEPTELFTYLSQSMPAAAAELKKQQDPEFWPPDSRPPRLTEDAKVKIRKLATYVGQDRPDYAAVSTDFNSAQEAAGPELEPKLVAGLILLQGKTTVLRDKAKAMFEPIAVEHADQWWPPLALAWLSFEEFKYPVGVTQLVDGLKRIKPLKDPNAPYPEVVQRAFTWIGQLREFAAKAATENRRPSAAALEALDAAIAEHGADAQRCYQAGKAKSQAVMDGFDQKIRASEDTGERLRLGIERRQLPRYATFPFEDAKQDILGGLDRQ
jgi:serine/threonine-protein kinase